VVPTDARARAAARNGPGPVTAASSLETLQPSRYMPYSTWSPEAFQATEMDVVMLRVTPKSVGAEGGIVSRSGPLVVRRLPTALRGVEAGTGCLSPVWPALAVTS
jgi:hypothetical protein